MKFGPLVVIPFVTMPGGQNPNVSKGAAQYDIYLTSAVVAFASLRRFNPHLRLAFASTEAPAEPYASIFRDLLNVEYISCGFEYAPPEGFAQTFVGSLYLLDVLEEVDGDPLVILDPDIVCVANLQPLLDAVTDGVGALPIGYARDHVVNGVSLRELACFSAEVSGRSFSNIYYGGESYVVAGKSADALRAAVRDAWRVNLDRFTSGAMFLRTEEHILTVVLSNFVVTPIDRFVKRIWTARSHRTVDGSEKDLLIWHLPSEKERGIAALFSAAVDKDSWFWRADRDDFVNRAGIACSMWGRAPSRVVVDAAARAARPFRAIVSRVVRRGH